MYNLEKEKVISLIGSGGKTSISFYLGQFFSKKGERVVLTTTTRVFPFSKEKIPLILEENREKRAEKVKELMKNQFLIQVGKDQEQEKVIGIEPETVEDLFISGANRVIVEADGSRGLPFKFPGDYEPVLPKPSGLVILVVGAWALGKKFSDDVFHRPELAREYLGWKEGDLIEGEQIVELLLHKNSYLPRLKGEKIWVVLNGIKGRWQENEAQRIGALLFRKNGMEKVWAINLEEKPIFWKLVGIRQE